MATEAPSTPLAPAGLLRRLAAAVYDLLPVAGVLMLVSYAVVMLRGGQPVPAGNLPYRLLLLIVIAGFYAGFWHLGGQTLGMRAWRLKLVAADGGPVSWRQCGLRLAAAVLAWAPLGLGVAWLLVDSERLAWHDRLSGTRVVRLPKSAR